jgi:hypothetical protein
MRRVRRLGEGRGGANLADLYPDMTSAEFSAAMQEAMAAAERQAGVEEGLMERDPKLKLSIELTKGEAEVLLILLDRIEPSSALAIRFAEGARLVNRSAPSATRHSRRL